METMKELIDDFWKLSTSSVEFQEAQAKMFRYLANMSGGKTLTWKHRDKTKQRWLKAICAAFLQVWWERSEFSFTPDLDGIRRMSERDFKQFKEWIAKTDMEM